MAWPNGEFWRDYLSRARWFQGKGLALAAIDLHPFEWYTTATDVWVRSELAVAEVGDQTQTYHLLTGYLPAGTGEPEALVGQVELPGRGLTDVVDAPRSPRAMAALLASAGANPAMTWYEPPPDPASPTAVFTGQQSNTTVRVGDAVLFKIFRRLNPGPNCESGVMKALAASGITPRLIGTLASPDGVYDLGIFCERIQHAQDGWAFCQQACGGGQSVAEDMARLGTALRHLHASLATAFGVSQIDSGQIAQRMMARLDAASQRADELVPLVPRLRAVFDVPRSAVAVQRVHGDFHLGQALLSPAGWTIIDFEGEPLATPAERTAPDTVWRDVAGLTRSLDYVRSDPRTPGINQAQEWYLEARTAFLNGYLGSTPLPQAWLTAYEVDKAIYEYVYELRNRPDWAGIPRHAIDEAIRGQSG